MGMNKREQQRQRRREEILLCAADLFITKGYEATGIRDIAARLNISTGLFFNYFESKEKAYFELIQIGVQTPRVLVEQCMKEPSPIQVFRVIAKEIFGALRESSFTAKMFLLMMQATNSESLPASVKELLNDFDMVTPMISLVRQGQALGEIRAGDPYAIAIAYWGAIQGIAEYAAVNPMIPLPEPEWIVQMIKK